MDAFNRIAVLNSLSAVVVAVLGMVTILAISLLYFKFMLNLKSDIKDSLDKAICKKIEKETKTDKKAFQDELIKKYMK